MLLLVVNYLMRTNNNIFLEQRNRQYWRNQIVKEIEERKKGNKDKTFDYDTYFKRERKLLLMRQHLEDELVRILKKH